LSAEHDAAFECPALGGEAEELAEEPLEQELGQEQESRTTEVKRMKAMMKSKFWGILPSDTRPGLEPR
jgi:hypothetical protein